MPNRRNEEAYHPTVDAVSVPPAQVNGDSTHGRLVDARAHADAACGGTFLFHEHGQVSLICGILWQSGVGRDVASVIE